MWLWNLLILGPDWTFHRRKRNSAHHYAHTLHFQAGSNKRMIDRRSSGDQPRTCRLHKVMWNIRHRVAWLAMDGGAEVAPGMYFLLLCFVYEATQINMATAASIIPSSSSRVHPVAEDICFQLIGFKLDSIILSCCLSWRVPGIRHRTDKRRMLLPSAFVHSFVCLHVCLLLSGWSPPPVSIFLLACSVCLLVCLYAHITVC